MNGDWYGWSPGVNGNTAAEYVAMWRHVHALFASEGATAVEWVWSPNVSYPGSGPLLDTYPGDDVVDWIGIDGYNWGDDGAGHRWQSFAGVFGPTYRELAALPGKPMMIAETASVEAPPGSARSKAGWIEAALGVEVRRFPRVRAVVWFDEVDGRSDFRLR
jgi:beta-mannanase